MEIAGRTALVTGGAAGAGRGIAEALSARGADVVVGDLSDRDVESFKARFVHLDVTDDDELAKVIAQAKPTILINNAGGGGHVPPYFPDGDWSAKLDLNLRAPMRAAQLALAHMRDGGAIVNIASSAGHNHDPHPSAEYAAAKAGLIRFTTATELEGVRMNCIVPDWILTERAKEELQAMTPEQRAAAPTPIPVEDIAAAVVALIEGDASRQVVVLP